VSALPANAEHDRRRRHRVRLAAESLRAAARCGGTARSWYRITNAAIPDEAEVMLYDEIGGWWGSTADEFIAELRGITAPNLRVRINSPGGSVFEGIAIANALRSYPGT
jgi:ATP-dependent protease ClpP protease subunit